MSRTKKGGNQNPKSWHLNDELTNIETCSMKGTLGYLYGFDVYISGDHPTGILEDIEQNIPKQSFFVFTVQHKSPV